ncbi:MAG: large-conductance mechanosensitive channel protein MscL [Patescibacteria group bacterium]|jgi:large conductance mechanosensitive channel
MKFLNEFKTFVMRGNVIDLAVGVVIGGAFGKIVTSIVGDIVMPPLGLLISNVNFKDLKWVMTKAADGTPLASINYGVFIQNVIEFIIIAAVIFIMIKLINKLQKQKEAAPTVPPPPTKEELLLTEIRDLLKK